MTTKTDGGRAFPWCGDLNECPTINLGMSMRDAFAIAALQGLLANPGGPIQANGMSGWNWCNCSPEDAVNLAYSIADAMLKAREET